MRQTLFSPLIGLLLLWCWGSAWAAPTPRVVAVPDGVWELAATHQAPFDMRTIEPLGGVVVISDLQASVAAVRPDSGLVVWKRNIPAIETASGVWPLATDTGGVVLAAGATLQAVRADVGMRLWERDLGCQRSGCVTRVVHATSHGGKSPVLFLAAGGVVQSELVRLDPLTGKPMWHRAAKVQHPKRVMSLPHVLVSEDALAPYAVRFFDPEDGRAFDSWEPLSSGIEGPVSELVLLPDGRTLAVDLRPKDGALAQVTLLSARGQQITERKIPKSPTITNAPVMAGAVERGVAVFTPDPARGAGFVTTMLLNTPWSAHTEQVPSWAEPLGVAGRWVLAPSLRAPGASWSAIGAAPWSREIDGVDPDPTETRTFVADGRVIVVDLGDPPRRSSSGHAVATLTATTGKLEGIGAHDLGEGDIDRVVAFDDELILTRGRTIMRLVLVPWHDAIMRLRATRDKGTNIRPWLQNFSRFGAPARALAAAVRASSPPKPPGTGPTTPEKVTTEPSADDRPALPPTELSAEDAALVAELRKAWTNPEDALLGMLALLDQAPEGSPRRMALLDAFAEIVLDQVLAPGVLPRGEDVATALLGLTRMLESEAEVHRPRRATVAIMATVTALIDVPLAGADVLARAADDNVLVEARLELARRALYLLHTSAGPLRTDTSRQMLVSALRLFGHLSGLVGSDIVSINRLIDQVAANDPGATRMLDSALTKAEGADASRRGAKPALCQLACEAALDVCGEGVSGNVVACQSRCARTGAVRFSNASRPSADPRWFCR